VRNWTEVCAAYAYPFRTTQLSTESLANLKEATHAAGKRQANFHCRLLAERRKQRGKLNYPEAIAYISAAILGARTVAP